MTNKILKTAYQYLTEKGYSVIPINKSDKKPAISAWLEFQKVPADPEQAAKWFDKTTNNIAIITGPISDITVIDLDRNKPDGKETPLEAFPKTFTVKTPSGGYHLYYKYSAKVGLSANKYPQFPHLDIRNDGGYVVAPPSKTDAGEYKIINDVPVADFPDDLF